jgi:hypothetical protein
MTTLASDSFNRANGALAGSTLDNAAGGSETDTWSDLGTAGFPFTVASNQAFRSGSPSGVAPFENIALVSTTAAGLQRATVTCVDPNDEGVFVRWQPHTLDGKFYLAYVDWSTAGLKLLRGDDGSYTQLGSTGSTVVAGDTVSADANGSSISAFWKGTSNVGPITDTTLTTGQTGMYAGGTSNRTLDNYLYEAPSGTARDMAGKAATASNARLAQVCAT